MAVTKEQRAEQKEVAKAAMQYFTQQGYKMRRESMNGNSRFIRVSVKDWEAVRKGNDVGLSTHDRFMALKIIYGNEYAEQWRFKPTAGNVSAEGITMTTVQWKRFLWMPA